MTATFLLRASGVILLSFLALAGCAADWWTVDQSVYHPPEQSADQTALFGSLAPEGGSRGTGDSQEAAGKGEEAGDPAFQPRPPR